jgi:hypothetical protein
LASIASLNYFLSILLVSMNSNNEETVDQMGAVFEEFSDGYPFDGIFLSDSFNRLYENDAQFAGMYTIFQHWLYLLRD